MSLQRTFSAVLPTLAGCAVLLTTSGARAQTIFAETGGIVAIEAESADSVQGWVEHEPDVPGARGTALRFTEGNSICSTGQKTANGFPPLEYHFRIATAGTYRLRLNIHKQVHCVSEGSDGSKCHDGAGCQSLGVQSDGDSCDGANECWRSDISNDAYVVIADDMGDRVAWVGGNTDITKLYGGNGTQYAWSGNSALDAGGKKHAPDWDLSPGDYVLEVRGRSRGFSFDRLILVESGADDGAARSAAESSVVEPMSGNGGGSGDGGGSSTGGASGTGATSGGGASEGSSSTGGSTESGDEPGEGTGSGDDSPSMNDSVDNTGCSWGATAPLGAGFLFWLPLLVGWCRRRVGGRVNGSKHH